MARNVVQSLALIVYRLMVVSGAIRTALGQRAYQVAYRVYKDKVEARLIDHLHQYVTAGSIAIDVGANIGFFATRFATWVGPEGKVIAIEPDQQNLKLLKAEIQKLKYQERVETHLAAASDKIGTVRLLRNEVHPGDHRISQTANGDLVKSVTVDMLVNCHRTRHVSFIKIDVQGAEMLVLKGALETIRRERPALLVEIDQTALSQFGSSSTALVRVLAKEGYRMFLVDGKGGEYAVTETELNNELHSRGYRDVLFRNLMTHF